MTQRDWIEKDFYRELGVASGASNDEIKKAYRKLARELHPDANPGDAKAEARFKAVSEAYDVLSDEKKRKEYDETRALFAGGGGGFGGGGFPGGFGTGASGGSRFDLNDLLRRRAQAGQAGGAAGSATCSAACSAAAVAVAPTTAPRSRSGRRRRVRADDRLRRRRPRRRGADPAVVARPLRDLRRLGRAAGHQPAHLPDVRGLRVRQLAARAAFAFSEPCRDCRGTGRIIDDPCPECGGDGVSTRTRTLTVRVPAGVADGNKVRLEGQGAAGHGRGARRRPVRHRARQPAPAVRRSRASDDLTLTVPVTFPEAGARHDADGADAGRRTVSLKVPAGTAAGARSGCAGAGCEQGARTGDLLVTVEVAVPARAAPTPRRARCSPTPRPRRATTRGPRSARRQAMTVRRCPPEARADGQPGLRDLGGRRAGRAARPDAAQLRPAGAGAPRPVTPAAVGATPPATSPCSARCSGCRRRRASTSPGIKRIIELEQTVDELRARLEEVAQELLAARAAAEQAAASVHASYRRDLVPVGPQPGRSSCGARRSA